MLFTPDLQQRRLRDQEQHVWIGELWWLWQRGGVSGESLLRAPHLWSDGLRAQEQPLRHGRLRHVSAASGNRVARSCVPRSIPARGERVAPPSLRRPALAPDRRRPSLPAHSWRQ
jgi:hypothetical protein